MSPNIPEPSIDDVMKEVTDAIQHSCAYKVDDNAWYDFLKIYKPKFKQHLDDGFSWNDERHLVLAAAAQHGFLAESFAKLARQTNVTTEMLLDAGARVAHYCNLGLLNSGQVGGWCS
jgi:hypothetical protein